LGKSSNKKNNDVANDADIQKLGKKKLEEIEALESKSSNWVIKFTP